MSESDHLELTPGWIRAQSHADQTFTLDANKANTSLFFQHIPAGTFWMGSRGYNSWEEPVHQVTISQPFLLGTFPVTQSQWRAVVQLGQQAGLPEARKLKLAPSLFSGALRPVEQVLWHECVSWLRVLNQLRLCGDLVFRLPTESEWEYACRLSRNRSGDVVSLRTEYHAGDGTAALDQCGWYSANSNNETHAVGLKQPTRFGLYDLHGNVWEWCSDVWTSNYRDRVGGVTDPGPAEAVALLESAQHSPDAPRVIRGGSWGNPSGGCRAAIRINRSPDYRFGFRGFRVCACSGPRAVQHR